jgi:putative transposase
MIKEKKHRLSQSFYQGNVRVTFTLCIQNKQPFFTDKAIVDKFIIFLKEAKEKHDCKIWAYIFMPDHIHLVVEGNSEKSDLWKTITLFKQKSGYWLAKNTKGLKWQKDFYDHIHRKDDDLIKSKFNLEVQL